MDPHRPAPEGHADVLLPLSVPALTAALDERRDRYVVTETGEVGGRWGDASIYFRPTGANSEVLHARVVAQRRLPAARRMDLYRFCNSWNHDKLLPTAYVHDDGSGQLAIVGEVSVDLEHGASRAQLAALVYVTISAGMLLAQAVGDLPDEDALA